MGNKRCSYHSENMAIDICERCNRPICLEGKRIYRKRHSRGTGSTRRTWTTRHVYCPPCRADVATNDASGIGAIFGSIFFIVIGLVITSTFAAMAGPFAIFPLFIVVLGIFQMFNRAKKAEDARKDEEQFLRSLDQDPDGISRTNKYNPIKGYTRPDKPWSLSEVSCFQCGNAIDLKANFCENCGDSTKDEKEHLEAKYS